MDDPVVLFLKAGLPDKQKAAATLGVNRSTISRWRSGAASMPEPVKMLLKVFAGEVLTDARHSYFNGWRFRDDFLISPENEKFTAADIKNIKIMYEELRSYRVQVRELKSEIMALKSVINELETFSRSTTESNVIPFPTLKKQG